VAARPRPRRNVWYALAIAILKPPLLAFTRRDWRGMEHLPARGGVILAINHVSYVDPFAVAHFVWEARRLPRYLAKAELFRLRFGGAILRGTGQIPVYRGSSDAAAALRDAVTNLQAGNLVIIYPEGTITGDPDYWPMAAKTGVARLALATGAPVIPVAQWGAQRLLGRDCRPRLRPRPTLSFLAGPPVDLSGYAGAPPTVPVLREITELVMGRVRGQLAELRGEQPPAEVYDPRMGRRVLGRPVDDRAEEPADLPDERGRQTA
jgi:1-acyl-sn-glycerol-3-phosphate acyltransferase